MVARRQEEVAAWPSRFAAKVSVVRTDERGESAAVAWGALGKKWVMCSTLSPEPIEVSPIVVRMVVMLTAQAVSGLPPFRDPRPMPGSQSVRLRGLGHDQTLFVSSGKKDWPILGTALVLWELHVSLLLDPKSATGSFEVLRFVSPEPDEDSGGPSTRRIWARFTVAGFQYVVRQGDKPVTDAAWLYRSSGELTELLPPLSVTVPLFVHPVAAWELLSAAEDLGPGDVNAKGWVAACRAAIASGAPYEDRELEEEHEEMRRCWPQPD